MTAEFQGAQLLFVEDDPAVVQSVREGLRAFRLDHAATVAEGRQRLSARHYDAVILDLTLPDGSGMQLADSLRAAGSDVPILILTAQTDVNQRLDGFVHGADDYLCKPFSVEELGARLNAILRRARPERRHVLRYGDLELDLLKRQVRRHDLTAALSNREADLLAFLIRHAEEVLPRARILDEIWGDEAEGESSVLNVYVNYLRNKLEGGRYSRLIHTVRGVGYVLSEGEP